MKKKTGKLLSLLLSGTMLLALTACGSGADTGSPAPAASGTPASSSGGDVAGTYSVTYSTQEISGNVRHTGYITAMSGQEKNTLELKTDGTYVYTKLVSTDPGVISGEGAASVPDESASSEAPAEPAPAAPAGAALFSWAPNNEGDDKGTCTLDFYADGTYAFAFPDYGMTESGTWSWTGWTMSVTKPSGTALEVAMDDNHALYFDYISDANEALHQNFIVDAAVWGGALGQTGSYTPTEGSEPSGTADELNLLSCYAGEVTRKTTEGNDYLVSIYEFLLSDGTAYIVEATDNSSSARLGTWTEQDGTIKLTDGTNEAAAEGDTITMDDAALTKTDAIPTDYQDADWAGLVAAAKAPAAAGPIILTYTFTGAYTVDGTTVILEPATACQWSEDWGVLQDQGFVNGSGTENDPVQPKGPSNGDEVSLDHFSGAFLIPTGNTAVKVEVDQASGSFSYVVESAFD